MNENFLTNIYDSLMSPVAFFEKLRDSENPPVLSSFLAVLLVYIVTVFYCNSTSNIGLFLLTLLSSVIIGLLSWVFTAGLMDLMMIVFGNTSKFNIILTSMGFSMLPWLLIAPVDLFKGAGTIGIIIAVILSMLVLIWSTVLFFLAISKTYNFSVIKIVFLAILPFLGFLIFVASIISYITTFIVFVTV